MKRPMLVACLFLVIAIKVFYLCFPPQFVSYEQIDGEKVYIEAKVKQIEYSKQMVLTLSDVAIDGYSYSHSYILCYLDTAVDLKIGQFVRIAGEFSDITPAHNEGQFNSKFYYEIQGIGAFIFQGSVLETKDLVPSFMHYLSVVKQYFSKRFDTLLEEPYQGMMQALLLGNKQLLNEESKELLQRNGMLHIFTISGLHISMIGMGIYKALRWCKCMPKTSGIISVVAIVLYGLMVGMGPSTFRAICMFLLQISAIYIKRTYDRMSGLCMAAMLLLVEQPLYIFYTGFLLSFGAVIGMTIMVPILEKHVKWKFGSLFFAGISIALFCLPIQMSSFYEYPIYSIFLNILLLPLLPLVVISGLALMIVPSLHPVVIGVPKVIVEGIFWFYELVCNWVLDLPFQQWILGAASQEEIYVYYSVLALALWLLHRQLIKVRYAAISILLALLFLCVPFPETGLHCNFLSVGQGDCAVIRWHSKVYIVDAGSSSDRNMGEDILIPYLKYQGISKVDAVFISHSDMDHLNGMIAWLEEYQEIGIEIKSFILPDYMTEEDSLLLELIDMAKEENIPLHFVSDGMKMEEGDLEFRIWNPSSSQEEDRNAESMVLELSYREYHILFTGDIYQKQEEEIVERIVREEGDIWILKSAHHGSSTSNSLKFLEQLSPAHTSISYGRNNSYGHPHDESILHMEMAETQIWETAKQGMITFRFYESFYELDYFLK